MREAKVYSDGEEIVVRLGQHAERPKLQWQKYRINKEWKLIWAVWKDGEVIKKLVHIPTGKVYPCIELRQREAVKYVSKLHQINSDIKTISKRYQNDIKTISKMSSTTEHLVLYAIAIGIST